MNIIRAAALGGVVAFLLAVGFLSHGSGQDAGQMRNCPAAGRWSIAVWDGQSGTAAADALATCGAGAVEAAYSLDAQTQVWSRWFAAKPEVSNLPPLNDKQGLLARGGTAAVGAAGGERLAAAQAAGQLQNCPVAGKWSIAVWDGPSGTAAADALATCGEGAVAAAYSLDPQTQVWSRWFAGKPEVSNLPPLNEMQGLLALGAGGGAPPGGPSLEPLAVQLYAAADIAAATPVLRQIYDYLGLGLYTADGEQIQVGAETGPDDFYLYDFESDLLGQAYVERRLSSADLLATSLGQVGIRNLETGQPITGSELLALLSAAVSRARGDDSLFTLRLVDSLGLVRTDPLDVTSSDLDPAEPILDPVQEFLILYDILAGLPAETGAAMAAEAAAPLSAAGAGPCEFKGSGTSRKGGSTLAGQSRVGDPSGASQADWDAVRGKALEQGYQLWLEPKVATPHWKHSAGDTGQDKRFEAKLWWDPYWIDPPVVKCGRLLGVDFGKEGPEAGIGVTWETVGEVTEDGSMQPRVSITDTWSGAAASTFVPNTEARPGQGPLKKRMGSLTAFVQFGSARWQGLVTKEARALLSVERHMNLTLEMEGSLGLTVPGGSVTFNYSKISIPLRSTQSLEGDGSGTMTGTGTFAGGLCTSQYSSQFSVHVTATESEPLTFTVSGTGSGSVTVTCPGGAQMTFGAPMGQGSSLTFSLAAEDGATYPYTPPAPMSGSVNFTLREQ